MEEDEKPSTEVSAKEGHDESSDSGVGEDVDILNEDEFVEVEEGSPPLSRSLDLSQYLEQEEALAHTPEALQESHNEYIQQILERFMPKFIKIKEGNYQLGGPKKQIYDRLPENIRLNSYFIGQLPISNDLFDFFVRETGYITEAEKAGYGFVTLARIRNLANDSGRQSLAITPGVLTKKVEGASWRQPDGPGSSLNQRSHHPVVQVSKQDALAFASWAGKRLPSEDEWEAAACGEKGFTYPWGNEIAALANLESAHIGSTIDSTFFGQDSLSRFGLFDMIGNVDEWTATEYTSPGKQSAKSFILKGGSWATKQATCASRRLESPHSWSNTIGFRLAVDSNDG